MATAPPPISQKNDSAASLFRWELCALVAACIILATPFLYKYRSHADLQPTGPGTAQFAGTIECKQCHQDAFKKWRGSDHDLAMAEATEKTVLGDFNNIPFTDPHTGKSSLFFRENGNFMVETEGPDGEVGTFTISHTFGAYPLQQYLVPFPGGRLQCLSIGWDVERKTWYRLPPYEVAGHTDWLHWTRGGQTWNTMCAECHSTELQKGYNLQTETYTTTWFEINVGCEACHGPGSKHVEWAKRPVFARPQLENYGLVRPTDSLSPEQQIAICAPCHSRRYQLGDNDHRYGELLDLMVPSLLSEGLYHPDGQILEEVYVYGSFVQSKMYRHGVRCSDCHDSHDLKPHNKDNQLCLQCHRAEEYDTKTHHFHEKTYQGKPSSGYLCVKCHMPGQFYMGIDYRPDHSLRIPRPDMSKKLGTPNGCSTSDCHADKSIDWTIEHYTKWYGQKRKPHYGQALAAGRTHAPGARGQLAAVISDELLPAIVRATALDLLQAYPGPDTNEILQHALQHDNALIRHTALRAMAQLNQDITLKLIAPKLYDPVKAVRIEAAVRLAGIKVTNIREADRLAFAAGLKEYRKAMEYNGDFAPQRYNLGNLEQKLGNAEKAKNYYLAAIDIDDQFFPAKVNLAMVLNSEGNNVEAEKLLRDVVEAQPELYETAYSLGLLLAEMEKYEDAAWYLARAADGLPNYSRARYNQGLALLKLERYQEGADILHKAMMQDPESEEYFTTLINLYLSFRMTERARNLAEEVIRRVPGHASARELLQRMKKNR